MLSGLFTLVACAAFFVPYYFLYGVDDIKDAPPLTYIPFLFGFYLVTYFIVIFFNTGLVACAHESLKGNPASFAIGLREARKRLPAVIGWSLISATVGVILRLMAEYLGPVARIVESIFGLAWSIATFFVIPILVVENRRPMPAVKESAQLLMKTWGARLVAGLSMGVAMLILIIAPLPLIIFALVTGIVPLIAAACALFVLWIIALSIVGAALQGIYQTALYLYATTGATPPAYREVDFAQAFKAKKSKGI
jgi:hypothetical protein